jgi:hypothetical protein
VYCLCEGTCSVLSVCRYLKCPVCANVVHVSVLYMCCLYYVSIVCVTYLLSVLCIYCLYHVPMFSTVYIFSVLYFSCLYMCLLSVLCIYCLYYVYVLSVLCSLYVSVYSLLHLLPPFYSISLSDGWLDISSRKLLRPTISAQFFLSFPGFPNECCDGSPFFLLLSCHYILSM